MKHYAVINPQGMVVETNANKWDYDTTVKLVHDGASTPPPILERVKVIYNGKRRDAYVDEEGALPHRQLQINPHAMGIVAPEYGNPPMFGNLVIWVPN